MLKFYTQGTKGAPVMLNSPDLSFSDRSEITHLTICNTQLLIQLYYTLRCNTLDSEGDPNLASLQVSLSRSLFLLVDEISQDLLLQWKKVHFAARVTTFFTMH